MTRSLRLSLLLLIAVLATPTAQQLPRRATNLAALITYPSFYHQRPVTVAGMLTRDDSGAVRLTDDVGGISVVYEGSLTDGLHEVRGDFWDLGRMNADDPRLGRFDVIRVFGIRPDTPWPAPGQVLAIIASAVQPVLPPVTPSIRTIVLHPSRFLEEEVTVVGQFTGRNLLGELPNAPANSQWDFVLRSGDGAIWVSNLHPRGRDFELSLDQRLDTGRWVEVRGVLRQARGLQWLDAAGTTLAIVNPPAEESGPVEEVVRVPAAPPPEAIFSAPTENEIDVDPSTTIRIQFSRDIDADTVAGNVRVVYEGEPAPPGADPPIGFRTSYRAGNRLLEITFEEPLARFRKVRVELLDGIRGTDDQPLVPWTLMFETGG
jgi:hypothetical protein